jgi:indoleamine 2,3-dioxygenase
VWIESGKILGVPPVATYAATVIFNIREQKGSNPEDFDMEFTFSGSRDEAWFYAISAAIDTKSSVISELGDAIHDAAMNNDSFILDKCGFQLAEVIRSITVVLNRMYELCRPEVFNSSVRPYLNGWLNDPLLPDGLCYKLSENDGQGEKVFMKLAGGSAAQNPTIQLIDVILFVKHGEDESSLMIPGCCRGSGKMNYLGAMRTYMPREHSQYLNYLEEKFQSVRDRFQCSESYKHCIEALNDFRSEHIKMVTRYIDSGSRGTGGSNPIPFLKKCRKETEEAIKR